MTTDKSTVTGHAGDAKAGRSPATQAQDQQKLQEQIDRTRQELGDTVEALAARADLKARARDEAEQLTARIGERVGEVREKASQRAGQIRGGAGEFAGKVRRTVAAQPLATRHSVAALTAAVVVVAAASLVVRRRGIRNSRR